MYFSKLIFTTSFFFLLGLSHLAAQTTTVIVSGTVIDQEDKPLPFANVILLDINSPDLITGRQNGGEHRGNGHDGGIMPWM